MSTTALPLNVLIVGAGMYVCGKGTTGYGTVLPAVLEALRHGLVGKIAIAAATRAGAEAARHKATELSRLMGVTPAITFLPSDDHDPTAYLQALASLPNPRAAIVSIPDHLHFTVTKTLIEQGVHVLVVKPLVARVDEATALAALAESHQVYGAVEFHKRFDEANLKLYEIIRQGQLGDILNFRIQYSQRKSIPLKVFRGWVEQTDVFQYLGVHYVDLISFLTGARPLRVMSVGNKNFLASQGIDTYDTIQTLIEWQTSTKTFLSSHLTGWIDPDTTSAMSDQRLEVIGTKGRFIGDQKNRGAMLVADGAGPEEINPYFTQMYSAIDGDAKTISGYGPQSIIQFLRDVADIVHKRKAVRELAGRRATFASSIAVAAVLEASRQSLASDNRWVHIP